MIVVRAFAMLVFVVLGVLNTVVAGFIGTVVGFIPPRGDWTLRGARIWARGILLGGFVHLRSDGREHVPRDEPVVFMANHESWLDIPALLAEIPVQVRFLAKKSLFSWPLFGWAIASMGFIPVDRKNRREAVKSFDEAAARIRAGRSVLIFPEETRSTDGDLLPFQRGGFLIAIKAGIPIVPVGLEGPRRCLPKFNYLIRPGTITVRFGEPIPTVGRGVTEKGELMEAVRIAIERLRNADAREMVPFDRGAALRSVGDGQ
ncbi:MAG: lysophospholipid acyltransferase family protein [Thermoanaerobaculaceae bacterium]